MNTTRLASLALAAFLHVAPFATRTFQALPSFATSPFAIVFKWAVGALAIAGSYHTVSAATATLVSAKSVSGKVGTRLSYQIRIDDGRSRTPRSWKISNQNFSNSGSTTVGMPPGLSMALSTGIIAGTPTQSGSFPVTMTAYEDPGQRGGKLTFTVNFGITGSVNPPQITSPPTDTTATEGDSVTLTVIATGEALSYQWLHDASPVAGATATALTLNPVRLSDQGQYTVTVSNTGGSVTTTPVTLTVNPALVATRITAPPTGAVLHPGEPLSLSVAAEGTAPLAYVWKRDGATIPGANDATFNLATTSEADAGEYLVEVSGPGGTATSDPVTLVVRPLSLTTSGVSSDAVQLLATTIPGRKYALLAADAAESTAWTTVEEFTAGEPTAHLTQPHSAAFRFWRYRTAP